MLYSATIATIVDYLHPWDIIQRKSLRHLGAVQVKGMRFVIFWFRRYEKIVLERRLTFSLSPLAFFTPSIPMYGYYSKVNKTTWCALGSKI